MNTLKSSGRILALDILRGITIAAMILVNNPGSWADAYRPLEHAEWNGLTPTDLVFPFFMFIMGMSAFLSLRKYNLKFSGPVFWKILRRSVLIYLIGMFLTWFAMFLRGVCNGEEFWASMNTFDHIRTLGVLPRLAICYGIGSLVGVLFSRKTVKWLVVVMLVAYAVMIIVGNGYEFSQQNIIVVVDRAVIGEAHMYTDWVGGISMKFDPEGFLSTLPSIAHMLIGFLCGNILVSTKDNLHRINRLFIVGAVLTFAGFLLSYGLPINKKIWSPTFVLTTCGLASTLLALLIWFIDVRGHRRWTGFFHAFGVNPLFLYCVSTVLGIAIGLVRFPYAAAEGGVITVKNFIFNQCLLPLCCGDASLASLLFSLLFVVFIWCLGYPLYRKKIYIRI